MKFIIALMAMVSIQANASQFEADTKKLFDVIYWPILEAVVPCTKKKIPDAVKRARCEKTSKDWGIRFVTEKEGKAEALACAKLHAGLLARNKVYRIIDDAATDPWTNWRCVTCTGTNEEDVAKRSVRTYVVDTEGNIYDHRMRYFLAPFYAKKLGMTNPRFANTLWSQRKGQLGDILSQQK